MLIYSAEKPLEDLVLANTSIAYSIEVEPLKDPLAIASIHVDTPNTADLYYTKSIFVTTNKNKNDDVFLPTEAWAARKTPVDKMWNIEHDHTRVVGHLISTWAINEAGEMMDDDIKDLPSLYHLCVAGVIYKKWQNAEMQEIVDELIEGISNGEWCTSMEAYFNDFSYVLEKGQEQKVVARDENTAFLTKHLRAYGGEGVYDGYKISRALRNIIFSGNAFTRRPANPASIILAKENNSEIISGFGVSSNKEEIFMSDNILEKQVADLKVEVSNLAKANKELSDELAAASVEKYEVEITSLKDQLAASQKELADSATKLTSVETAKSAIADELKSLSDKYNVVVAELDEVKKQASQASRVEKLKDAGLSQDDAVAKATKLSVLSDEQFAEIVAVLASVKPPVVPGTQSAPAVPGSQEPPIVSGSDVEVEEEEDGVDATLASEKDNLDNLMASFATYYEGQLLKEKK